VGGLLSQVIGNERQRSASSQPTLGQQNAAILDLIDALHLTESEFLNTFRNLININTQKEDPHFPANAIIVLHKRLSMQY